MRLRNRSVRARVVLLVLVPLLSLIAVYGYAASGASAAAASLASAGKVGAATITPTANLIRALDGERSLAVLYLDSRNARILGSLRAQEGVTDRALRAVQGAGRSGPVAANASGLEKAAAATLVRAAGELPELRAAVAGGAVSRTAVISRYSTLVTDGTQVLAQSIQKTDVSQSLVTTALQEVSLYESEQLVLEENDIYTGDVLARRLPEADRMEIAELAGVRRFLVREAVPQLDASSARLYRRYLPAELVSGLTRLENAIVSDPVSPPVPLALWQGTVRTYVTSLATMLTRGPDQIQAQVTSSARKALLELILAVAAGLLAVVASVVFSVIMGRSLLRRLAGLRQSALEVARDRLPSVVARLRDGQAVDVLAEAPPVAPTADEIDQVHHAFSIMHRAALEVAVGEAELRRSVNAAFRNLARRSQELLHRQLGLLDGLERRAGEPEQLEDLFRIDHLTTRMRRHAEGLIILSGQRPGRRWSRPVLFIDILRAAAAEVEDYGRIHAEVTSAAALAGDAVADVIHLLAELAENAAVFSPPGTPVRIRGSVVGRGFAVEIEDRGLGMARAHREEINRRLADPVTVLDLSGSDRLGLFIAGRLAHRHGITVALHPSPYGGTTAIVFIPVSLVTREDVPGPDTGARRPLTDRSAH
jgi:signal transduction histidine kinase